MFPWANDKPEKAMDKWYIHGYLYILVQCVPINMEIQ